MKNFLALLSGLLLSAAASFSFAGPAEPNTYYVGGALGKVTLDIDASLYILVNTDPSNLNTSNDYDDKYVTYTARDSEAFMLAGLGGYNISDSLAVEAQVTWNMLSDEMLGREMTVDMQAMGIYGVWQAGGEAYLKIRLGLGRSTADFETTYATASESSVYASWGLSVGHKVGPGAVEFMYMRYPDVEIDRAQFKETFNSGDYTISRDLTFETLTLAYIYTF